MIGCEERLQNDLFCVVWDVIPQLNQSVDEIIVSVCVLWLMCTDSTGLAVLNDGLAGVLLSVRTSAYVLPPRLPARRRGTLACPPSCLLYRLCSCCLGCSHDDDDDDRM